MMLGGSPIRVAVPPILEARISGMSKASGEIPRDRAISMDTGVNSSIVVTLSRNAEATAVKLIRIMARIITLPRAN